MSALPTEPRVRVRDDQATRLRAMLSHNRPAPAQPEQSPEETQLKRPPMIAVASGKGGVGKTFTSVSLATALAAMGRRITLIDADFGAANADIMLGLAPLRRLDECLMHGFKKGHALTDIAIDSRAGFNLVPGPVGLGMAPASADRSRLVANTACLSPANDAVIVDCSAGVGAGVLDIAGAAEHTVVVLTPEPTAIADAYALVKSLYRRVGPGIGARVGVIVNQANSKSEAERVHRRISAVSERFLGFPLGLTGVIPSDKTVGRMIRDQRVSRDGRLRSTSGKAARLAARQVLARLSAHGA